MRSGGDVTGMFLDIPDLLGKQLGLLREVVPRLSRVAVFGVLGLNAPQFAATETAARAFAVETEIPRRRRRPRRSAASGSGATPNRIAGRHRFEAAGNCGHQTIRAEVYVSLSDDEAELIQIDENLVRANLSDAERILHVARWKELYEKLHPETKHGGDRRSAGARSSSQNENLKAFVADIAVKTGKGRSTV
jgi:hypothetical protein